MKSSEKNKIASVLLVITLLAGAAVATIADAPEASAQEPGYGEEGGGGVSIPTETVFWGSIVTILVVTAVLFALGIRI